MRKRNLAALILAMLQSCVLLSQAANHKPSGFYFNGKEFHLGMSQTEALAELSECCNLSPPPKPGELSAANQSVQPKGYFVISKEERHHSILGSIWFKGQKVVGLSHELALDVDTSSDDLVAFMRDLKRSLPEEETTAVIEIRHEQMSNAESDILTLAFPDGRRIEIRIGTLDKAADSKRDFVTMDEVLGSTE